MTVTTAFLKITRLCQSYKYWTPPSVFPNPILPRTRLDAQLSIPTEAARPTRRIPRRPTLPLPSRRPLYIDPPRSLHPDPGPRRAAPSQIRVAIRKVFFSVCSVAVMLYGRMEMYAMRCDGISLCMHYTVTN